MSEDTPVNAGVAHWPESDSAWWAVRKMQIKLHRWVSEDSARRFDDLYNLVCDPAFLVHAFERVATNAGARTPGIDRATVAWIRHVHRHNSHRCLSSLRSYTVEITVPLGESGFCDGADDDTGARQDAVVG